MLSVIGLEESQKWDDVVRSFNEWDIYYLSGYLKACHLTENGKPTLFYYEENNMRVINVAIIRDIAQSKYFTGKLPLNTYYDMSTPYGYGGFLTEGNVTREGILKFMQQYSSFCNKYGIISEFIRFHPMLRNHNNFVDLYDVQYNRDTIFIDLENEEVIWNNMKSSSRNRIKNISNMNISVVLDSSGNSIEKFIELYYKTMDKNNAHSYYYFDKKYFYALMNLNNSCEIFNLLLDDEIIASMIVLIGNQFIHYHLGATNPNYYSISPNNLLFYEVARWGARNGFKGFHLGGGYLSNNDGLFRFKKTLNRNGVLSFFIGKRIFNQEIYNKLIDIRKIDITFDENVTFFPAYRG